MQRGDHDVFEDKVTGASDPSSRQGWQMLLDYAREGDTIVVFSMSRLGRSLLTVVLTERRPPELRRARWLGDEASRMREGTTERRLVEDARDDEIVGWVIARTGPGEGILFLIATYLWGVAAVLGIVAIIAALAAIASPPLFSAAGMYGIATILTITLSAIPYGVEQARRQARSRAVRSALGLRDPVAEWRTRTGSGAESPRTGTG